MGTDWSEPVDVRPESVLWEAALPLRDPLTTGARLLEALCLTFRGERAALIWKDPDVGGLSGIAWSTESTSPVTLPAQRLPAEDDEELSLVATRLSNSDSRFASFAWESLPSVEGMEALLGLSPAPVLTSVPTSWKACLSQLLSAAARNESWLMQRKLSALAEYAAGAGHEINNPLGSIIGRASQLLQDESDPERRQWLETIGAQAYRVRDMIGDTMLFGRPPAPQRESHSIRSAIEEVFERHRSALPSSIQLQLLEGEDCSIQADRGQLLTVFSELTRNGIEAMGTSGTLKVRVMPGILSGRSGVRIEVSDTGPPLTDEEREHCFDPFYSGRQAGRGLGFGLTKCWRIVRIHGGSIRLGPTGGPKVFRIWLPETGED